MLGRLEMSISEALFEYGEFFETIFSRRPQKISRRGDMRVYFSDLGLEGAIEAMLKRRGLDMSTPLIEFENACKM